MYSTEGALSPYSPKCLEGEFSEVRRGWTTRDTKPADATCSLSEEAALGSPSVERNPHLDLGARPRLRVHPQATAKHL
jgi:hypothetical protein